MTGGAQAVLAADAADPELAPIADICSGRVVFMTEGDRRYIFMEGLHFLVRGNNQKQMDALLCLNYPNSSYPTKLYLPENLGLSLNWNENAYILGRQWFSWSWNNVAVNQAPFAILAEHLRAFQ
jgi:hypothetical protein